MSEIPVSLRASVGGHAAGAMAGLHPFITPMQIYAELRAKHLGREIERQPPSLEMLMGLAMEPTLEKLYREETGHDVQPSLLLDTKRPWRVGHPDGVRLNDTGLTIIGGVDYKNTSGRHPMARWQNGTVPEYVAIQAQWYMSLIGPWVESWDIWASVAGSYPALFTVPADPGYQGLLVKTAEDFLIDHVIPGIPPDADSSEGSQRALRALHPKPIDRVLIETDSAEFAESADAFVTARATVKAAEDFKTAYSSKLMSMIGDGYGLTNGKHKAIWAGVAGRSSLDVDGLLNELSLTIPTDTLKALRLKHTKAGAPGRRLTVTEIKPGDGDSDDE